MDTTSFKQRTQWWSWRSVAGSSRARTVDLGPRPRRMFREGVNIFSGPGCGLLFWASPTGDFHEQHCLPWDKCEKVFFQRRGWTMRRNHVFHNLYLERIIALVALTMIRRLLGSSSTLSWCSRCFSWQGESQKPDACRGHRINCGTALGYLTTIIPALSPGRHHHLRCRMFGVAQGAVLCHFSRRVSVFRSFVVAHLVQSSSSQLRDLGQIASAISCCCLRLEPPGQFALLTSVAEPRDDGHWSA